MTTRDRYDQQISLVLKMGDWLTGPSGRALPCSAWKTYFARYQAELRYLRRLADEWRPDSLLLRLPREEAEE